jgi:hypothetical protein
MQPINRALLVSAATLATATSLQAQSTALGSPVSASGSFAGEDSLDRAALYTQSAFVAPQGRFGFTVQALGSRTTIEDATGELKVRGTGAGFSTFYGVTQAITLGAGLPYASVTSEFAGLGESSTDGLGDLELFGRMRAYRSMSGATKLALGAGLTLPTGEDAFTADDPTYQLGGAMTHRVNGISFHVAPDMRIQKDFDPSFDLNLAASFAATPKLALSVEGLSSFEGAPKTFEADRMRTIDLGAGFRYNAVQNLVLDLGLRTNVSNNVEEVNVSGAGMTFGFNWLF